MYALIVLAACNAPSTETGETSEETGRPDDSAHETGDTDTHDTDTGKDTGKDSGPETFAFPWDMPAFFEDPGPLHALIEADPDEPGHAWSLRMATSADGVEWVESDAVIASDFNSLDLIITDEGVILTGLPASDDIPLRPGSVYVLASADLTRWASREWPITDPVSTNLVDPSLHLRADGTPELVYYSCDTFGSDPVWVAGDHAIRRAAWDGTGWHEDATVAYADDFLVDPVICDLDGQEWLFATQAAEHIVVASGNGDGTFTGQNTLTWGDHTVPYCTPSHTGDTLNLYAQGLGVTDLPYVASFDGTRLTEQGRIYAEHLWGTNNCSAPVMGWYRDQYVLFCAIDLTVNNSPG